MKRFVKEILTFLIPIFILIVLYAFFYFISYQTGEFNSVTENINIQNENPEVLLGLGYNEQTQYYKLLNANERHAEIIALGTSRVMQFRDIYFNTSFYNCGGAVNENFDEYKNFLMNLDYKPNIIILGLDMWVFNDTWNKNLSSYDDYRQIQPANRNTSSMLKAIINDWFSRKWSVNQLNLYPDNIGFNGRIKNNGFRYDGSYYYGNPSTYEPNRFDDTTERILNQGYRFEWAEHIDYDSITKLDDLLDYCVQNNIYVIGFMPPFAPDIYKSLTTGENYAYLQEIYPVCNPLFNKRNFELYDFSNGSSLKMSEKDFVDGFHGNEYVYAQIITDISTNSKVLQNCINPESLNFFETYNEKKD